MAAPETLASDAEREHAAERLRAAAAEGRLTTEEFSERVDRVYAARTQGELEELFAGLPQLPAPAKPRRSTRERLWHLALWFVPPNLVCIGIWAASGANGDFWPKWVLLGTGIRLLFGARRLVFDEPHGPPRLPPGPPGLGPRR